MSTQSTRILFVACLAVVAGACSNSGKADDVEEVSSITVAFDDPPPAYQSIEYDARGFRVDGQYRLLRGGSLQWFRLPEAAWDDRLARFRAAGFNTVDVYVPWNVIEPEQGQFEFERPDLRRFLELCRAHGLYVYLRPGPYITNEIDGGGVPAWVMTQTTKKSKDADGRFNLRVDDPDYLALVERYFGALNEVVRPYLITNGGPIILYGIENEYDWFEIFHTVDKLFWFEGGLERAIGQTTGTAAYMTALRDIVRGDGIDVPITTCPGDAKVAATGDVPGVIPMPNIYKAGGTERIAYDIVTDMHDPSHHGGAYVAMPSGSTETERTPARLERLVLGGLDGFFAFNVVGMHTDGYRNAVVLDNAGPRSIFELSTDRILDAFVAPSVGYFHNVVDYYGAIGPSGTLRRKFWSFRRTNLMLDAFEPLIAGVLHPKRSGAGVAGADPRLRVAHDQLGAIEDGKRVYYWLDAGATQFVGLTNETGRDQVVPVGAIEIDGHRLPEAVPMVVPVEDYPGPAGGGTETENVHMLVVGAPTGAGMRLAHTTSELLTLRDFGPDRLLIVHGVPGSWGELALDSFDGPVDVIAAHGVEIVAGPPGRLLVTYAHTTGASLTVRAGSHVLHVLVTTRDDAGRAWFFEADGKDLVVIGPDLARPSSDGLALSYESRAADDRVLTWSVEPLVLAGFTADGARDPITGAAWHHRAGSAPPTVGTDLRGAGALGPADLAETAAIASGDGWIRWTGAPRPLEMLGIPSGHAWYRASVRIDGSPANRAGGWKLWIDHASDFVGIYVNGHYVTTLAPLGTEIDNRSWTPSYAFPDVTPYLIEGENVLAFRVEIWGHGSFMWPRGNLLPTKAQLPSLGFDAVKGLWGNAELGGVPLTRWEVRAGLGGERAGWSAGDAAPGMWTPGALPTTLVPGAVTWYRIPIAPSAVADPASDHAPVVVRLRGRDAKATVWLNGQLIGRWLSDDAWLRRGTWARGRRDMWMNTSPDDFPIDIESLARDGSDVLAIAFEDASAPGGPPGRIDELALAPAREERSVGTDGSVITLTAPARRGAIRLARPLP